MPTPENKAKKEVKEVLAEYPVPYFMPRPDAETGISDFVCCAYGWYMEIEAKRISGEQSARQKLRRERILLAGGKYFIYRPGDQDNLRTFINYLKQHLV